MQREKVPEMVLAGCWEGIEALPGSKELRGGDLDFAALWNREDKCACHTRTLLSGCPMDYSTLPIGFQTGHPLEGPGIKQVIHLVRGKQSSPDQQNQGED